ncbi:MAG TPA: glycoside hydrolase/phage tail family protein, partial [Hyphomonadaceae bacterium]|nr:glycoside hydrolase/phage tail family protein [Hyphomonadaceae bacterium]
MMAELVLGKAGAVLGGGLGEALGSLAGAWIDASLAPPVEGPRMKAFHLTESREGAGVPIVYGRARVGGQLIWTAEFKERREVEGGKGGPRVADYSYSLSFAVALCEGEIARVSRCWANGEQFDLSRVTWRLYKGTEDQAPDPLIEAIEDEAPGYRGIAYIVFEDMPVDQFGARMPQLSFEVFRPAGGAEDRLENVVRAVNIIPGSGEFALSTDLVRRNIGPGRERAENLHGPEAKSDFEASLEALEAELPNVTRVNLLVAWFGSDLRCGECEIRPGVEIAAKVTKPHAWSVAGINRGDAYVVSSNDGRPNYGGTPSDTSVRQAIAALKARGYHVTLYPFLLMDIPAGNGLPDPHGGAEQAAFPWRGRVTPVAGDVDAQVDAFFSAYRPFILHYAQLAEEEGADGILIGSELVGLTRTPGGGGYPAVEAMCALAADVREIVGSGVEVSYAADWTEYGAHVVGGDVSFPLDALWASDAIDYVGLDWYPPMADWRDGGDHADAAFGDGRSRAYLAANIAGGEGFDWFYSDGAARAAQERLPIMDGAYGEPWVFRQKDIAGWWSHAHHPRTGGVPSAAPTGWAAGMKPVRFVELGAPAVDKGANQPNVFFDPKSSESALPHFSDGSRDDLIQRRAIEAFHAHWSADAGNPASAEYDGQMVPADGVAIWAWDARPFPAFPAQDNVWGDAENWRLGHWLNGRVGLAMLPDVVADVCGRSDVACDVSELEGIVSGYRFDGPASARSVLEPLMLVHGVDATERDGQLVFRMRGGAVTELQAGRLVDEGAPALQSMRTDMEGEEVRVRLRHIDAEADHQPGLALSSGSADAGIIDVVAPL